MSELETLIARLELGESCIRDIGSGKGGWAWEEVADDLRYAREAIQSSAPTVSAEDRSPPHLFRG